jgi:hypothetical protein
MDAWGDRHIPYIKPELNSASSLICRLLQEISRKKEPVKIALFAGSL